MEDKLRAFNDYEKSKNVILFNVKEEEDVNKSLFSNIKELIDKAEVEIPDTCIVDIFRLGRIEVNNVRPVIIKLIAPRWKQNFFKKEENFKNMENAVSSDISKEKRELKNKLLKARYKLRQDGKEPMLRNYKLYLDNRCLTPKEISVILDGNYRDNEIEISENENTSEVIVPENDPEKNKKQVEGLSKQVNAKSAGNPQSVVNTRSISARNK